MPSPFAAHWTLEPGVTFLNHGSFGATPREVLAEQGAWRERMEAEPVRFFAHEAEGALDDARGALAAFVGADADDLAWVPNATTGVNTVLRSLSLQPGDELLTTDHEYNAVRNAMQAVADAAGAQVVTVPIPFPGATPDGVVAAILAQVTPRTRLAVVDHVTSATGLVLPVERLASALAERGVEMLIDGAHGPGMLPLTVERTGAAYYTGNLHKWVCAPKGAAFLWVRRDRQAGLRPLVISHGANAPRTDRSRFRLEFDWTGTADVSAYLAVPAALRFGAGLLPGGWDALRARNHDLALDGRAAICAALGIAPPVPDAMIGSMASVPLAEITEPGGVQGVDLYADPVHAALLADGFQVMVTPWPQRPDGRPWRRLVRISAAAYNDTEQYARLASVLPAIVNATHPRSAWPA
jgi:isopenicillin-N epimerase